MREETMYTTSVREQIEGLRRMTVGQLKTRYREVFHRKDGHIAGYPDNSRADLEAMRGVFDGVILNFTREQLEPSPGAWNFKVIDAALANVRAYKKNSPKPLRVGLRIWAGPNAPVWAKSLGDDPVTVYHLTMPVTVGCYRAKPYRDAWRKFMLELSTRYDSEPLISQITNSSGSSITDEPLIVAGDPKSPANLKAAGFEDKMFLDTRLSSPEDYSTWKTTIVEYPFSPYRNVDSGQPRKDTETTFRLMREWRQKLGPRGLLGNHALNFPPAEHLVEIYTRIKELGQPMEFQTHAPRDLDWKDTVKYAVSLGATALELWPGTQYGGFTKRPTKTLNKWSEALRSNVKN